MVGDNCYFDNELCKGQLWQCQTCGEWYCETHWHKTEKGVNVECVACEYNSADYERQFPSELAETIANS